MPRTPYANRIEIIQRYCHCTWRPAKDQPNDPDAIRTVRDASKCPLHGDQPDDATPEDW